MFVTFACIPTVGLPVHQKLTFFLEKENYSIHAALGRQKKNCSRCWSEYMTIESLGLRRNAPGNIIVMETHPYFLGSC